MFASLKIQFKEYRPAKSDSGIEFFVDKISMNQCFLWCWQCLWGYLEKNVGFVLINAFES